MYICYIWKYNCDSTAMLSRDGESFEDFKHRVAYICPLSEGYHYKFSEFKEIYQQQKSWKRIYFKLPKY